MTKKQENQDIVIYQSKDGEISLNVNVIDETWKVIQDRDLKTFIEVLIKRVENYKGRLITGKSVINSDFINDFEKKKITKDN